MADGVQGGHNFGGKIPGLSKISTFSRPIPANSRRICTTDYGK